jgi:hypothetical protein
VEALRIGDPVDTLQAGPQPIKWIGRRTYAAPFAQHAMVRPIHLRAGAIADGIPARDLFVSPGHALCLHGSLIHAWRLINGVSITQIPTIERIEYFHIELATHQVLFAEAAPAESFSDETFRQQFHNAADYAARYPGAQAPDTLCRPFLHGGFALQAIQQRLARRAGIPAAPSSNGKLRGYIDQTGPTITGWAQDLAAPDKPVCLQAFAGAHYLATLLANEYRADLRAAGIGDGCHAFSFTPPPGLTQPVEIRRAGDGAPLTLTEQARGAA